MGANWEGFNQGIQDLGSQLGGYFQKKKDMQDAIQMIFMKAQIENQAKYADPYHQALTRLVSSYLPENPSPDNNVTTSGMPSMGGSSSSNEVVGVNKSDYFLKPSFGPTGPSFSMEMKPEASLRNKLAEQKATQELKSQISPQKQQDDLQKASLAYQNLQYLKDKVKNLPAGYGALRSNFSNFFSRGETNPQLALYEKQMPAIAVAIYREITGDTRLSDQDAASRAYPLLWDARKGEGASIKAGVFNDLEKMYQARIRLIQRGNYKPNPKDSSEMITPLEDILAEAKAGGSTSKNMGSSPNENVISQYMQKYPGRSREEIIRAMQKQGM